MVCLNYMLSMTFRFFFLQVCRHWREVYSFTKVYLGGRKEEAVLQSQVCWLSQALMLLCRCEPLHHTVTSDRVENFMMQLLPLEYGKHCFWDLTVPVVQTWKNETLIYVLYMYLLGSPICVQKSSKQKLHRQCTNGDL